MVPQLSGVWQHKYSTKTRQAGQANEHQSMYSLMPMLFVLCVSTKCLSVKVLSTERRGADVSINDKKMSWTNFSTMALAFSMRRRHALGCENKLDRFIKQQKHVCRRQNELALSFIDFSFDRCFQNYNLRHLEAFQND